MRMLFPAALVLTLVACSSGGSDAPPAAEPVDGPPSSGEPQVAVSALYVVGDSLSDVGNAAAMVDFLLDRPVDPPTVGLCNPADVLVLDRGCDDLFYRQARVSDGAVAVEHLATALGLEALEPSTHLIPGRPLEGTNYAVASAKARARNPEDLESQIDWLALDHAPLASDAAVVVMIGGNDAIDALQSAFDEPGGSRETSLEIVASAVDAIGTGVRRLLDAGARILIVANVPDLSALPAVRMRARESDDEAAILALAEEVSQVFDTELDAELDAIEASGAWTVPAPPVIVRFDLRAALGSAQLSVEAEGGNALAACFDSEAYRASDTAERTFHPDCAPLTEAGPRFDEFVYWDGIHPTGAAHEIVGMAMAALPLRPVTLLASP